MAAAAAFVRLSTGPFLRAGCAALAAILAAAPASSQIPHDCGKPQESEFRLVTVVSRTAGDLNEPVKMDFDMDAEGNVDIYWVERTGRLRKYDAKTKLSSVVGRPDNVFAGDEHGLNGIALDPAFRQNRRVFLYHSVSGVGFRVMRYTLDAAGQLDNASKRIVLEIQGNSKATDWHTGGAMKFDPEGNLWISVGENKSYEAGPPNTNDLRGKILRIRPRPLPEAGAAPAPGPGSTYDIPAGNLFPEGTAKTRPEIYVMGTRNAYTLDYDARTRRLLWGCVGPDGTGRATEEHNMTATPGFFGWPYFAGQNQVIQAGKDPAKPVNTATGNTGLTELPPARGAVNSYSQSAAITGPVYRYSNVESRVKLPPYFDGIWFTTDFNRGTMDTVVPNASLTNRTAGGRVFANLRLDRPVDFKQGPDGALYAINYAGYFSTVAGTAIVRIEYTGSCRPAVSGLGRPGPRAHRFHARGFSLRIREAGHRLRVSDLSGRVLYEARSARGGEDEVHDLAPALHGRAWLYVVTVDAPSGARSGKLALPAAAGGTHSLEGAD